jgi:putative flippase GtrA
METDTRRGGLAAADQASGGHRRMRDWVRFSIVGASGIVVNQILVIALTEILGVYYIASAMLATFGSSTWNFIGADTWVFGHRRRNRPTRDRYLGFLGLNLVLLIARVPMLWVLTEAIGLHYAVSNIVSLGVVFGLRLAIADRWLWGENPRLVPTELADESTGEAAGESHSRHRYDLAGLLAIESDVELRELRSFASTRIGPPDIKIRVGFVGTKPARRVTFKQQGEELVYREHFGPLSANFTLRMGDPIEIKVSPILAMSPHVVYTNIVEAFLRFLLVSKGYVLLHSAALVGEHGATLLSAQTDTGKTSTVISLVRSRGYRFLSDDMTIIDPIGDAISYPKPMTLSFHTMGVAKDGRLSAGDRGRLAIQSRLHSKSGREVGRALGEKNLPIMTINSAVQFLVPPPKHRIEDLFVCAVGGRAPIRNIVLMERGEELLESVELDAAVEKLLENTDDAYGFPPFALFAPMIRIGGDDYAALRRKEADLLRSAIQNAQRWHLRVKGHEWADRLPALIDRPHLVPVGPGVSDPAGDDLVAVGPGIAVPAAGAAASVAAAPSLALSYLGETGPEESSGFH